MSPYLEPKHGHLSSSEMFQSRSSHEDFRAERPEGSNSGVSPGQNSANRHQSWQDLTEPPLANTGSHYLQTMPSEAALLHEARGQLSVEYRRQSTLPAQRSVLQDQYGPLPLPLSSSVPAEAGGKPRSFTLPRDSGLHAILAASASASEHREPQHRQLGQARAIGQTPHSLTP